VRILEVTVQPGEVENMHHHPRPSVFAHDAPMPKITNSFADDGSVIEIGRNLQYRIEFKRVEGNAII
jgi:hypothetical protein